MERYNSHPEFDFHFLVMRSVDFVMAEQVPREKALLCAGRVRVACAG